METARTNAIPWRAIGWGVAALLLLAPLVIMQFTSEVAWKAGDFLVFGAMLLVAGIGIELAARYFDKGSARLLAIGAVILGFLWLWAELAVGVFTGLGS